MASRSCCWLRTNAMPPVIASSAQLQARARRRLACRARAAGAPGRGDAVGGAGEVEQVRALRVIQLQRPRHRVEHGRGCAGDRAALELGVVLDADPGEHRDLGAAQARDTPVRPRGDARRIRGELRAARHQELAHLGSVVHAVRLGRMPRARDALPSTPLVSDSLTAARPIHSSHARSHSSLPSQRRALGVGACCRRCCSC